MSKETLTIHLVFPKLPPDQDAIGDHTVQLATALAQLCQVSVLTAQDNYQPLPNVLILSTFSLQKRKQVYGILDAIEANPPDWLVLQYNAFSYGRWGLNWYLPSLLREIKRKYPKVCCGVIAHETWPPPLNFRLVVMSIWQRWQLWQLGNVADLMFFCIEPWVKKFQQWFPNTPVRYLPVSSNIPDFAIAREEARSALGICDQMFIVGLFGKVHHSRMFNYVKAAIEALSHQVNGKDLQVVYIGPHGHQVKKILGDIPFHDAGLRPPKDVSCYFSAMDLYLSPYKRGVSTRRGSFLVAIQHGIPTVSTVGCHTDPILKQHNGTAFLLAQENDLDSYCQYAVNLFLDPARRQKFAQAAYDLYHKYFTWEVIATQLLENLSNFDEDTQ